MAQVIRFFTSFKFLVLLIVIFSTFLRSTIDWSKCDDVFSAMADMETLLIAENQLDDIIDRYIELEMKRLEKLKRTAKEYKKNRLDIKDGTRFFNTPLNSYLFIKRLTNLTSIMKQDTARSFLKNLTIHHKNENRRAKLPDRKDLKGAATALLRLQSTYKLETRDLADGKIIHLKGSVKFEAHDCFELGRIAYNQHDYYHTVLWMNEALNRLKLEKSVTISESDILDYLSFALYKQGDLKSLRYWEDFLKISLFKSNLKRALIMTKKLNEMDPDRPRIDNNIKYYESLLAKEAVRQPDTVVDDNSFPPPLNNTRHDEMDNVTQRDLYEALCRGEYTMSEKKKAELHCYFKRNRPFLLLAPLKVEIIHLKPKIFLFRKIISDQEIDFIKRMATPKLDRALVFSKDRGQGVPADYRVAKSAWLEADKYPVVEQITRRQLDMTDLSLENTEELQVQCIH